MPCCSYCQSANHNIIECNVDNDLVKMMECKTCPDFFHMSSRILKKIASQLNIKTSLPKIQLACSLSQYHRRQEREKEQKKENRETYEDTCCPICLEEFSEKPNNQSMTECGHKFCTSCLMQHLRKNNSCPCCRTQLIEERRPPMQHLYRYPSGPPLIPIGRNQPNMELLQALELPPLPQMPMLREPETEMEPGEIEENIQTPTQMPNATHSELMHERNDMFTEIASDYDPLDILDELATIDENLLELNEALVNVRNTTEMQSTEMQATEMQTIENANSNSPTNVMRQVTPEPTIRREAPPLMQERNRRNRGNITLRHYQQHFSR